MSKSNKKQTVKRKPGGGAPIKGIERKPTSWVDHCLRALSVVGVMLTLYLTWVASQGTGVAFCDQGSGCDVIQQSQWSRFLGIPLAAWGLGLYILLAINSFSTRSVMKRWKRLWRLSFIGVVISVYLTLTGIIALGSVCLWCLGSFAMLLAIFGLVQFHKPQQAMGPKRANWYLGHLLLALTIVGAMFISGADLVSKRGDPRLHELAQHLTQTDAKFYGAFWCPSCAEQKRAFSGAAEKLPYVECSPGGRNSPMTNECVRAGVSGFPTWVIDGKPYVGVRTPEELAGLSGYRWERSDME